MLLGHRLCQPLDKISPMEDVLVRFHICGRVWAITQLDLNHPMNIPVSYSSRTAFFPVPKHDWDYIKPCRKTVRDPGRGQLS